MSDSGREWPSERGGPPMSHPIPDEKRHQWPAGMEAQCEEISSTIAAMINYTLNDDAGYG